MSHESNSLSSADSQRLIKTLDEFRSLWQETYRYFLGWRNQIIGGFAPGLELWPKEEWNREFKLNRKAGKLKRLHNNLSDLLDDSFPDNSLDFVMEGFVSDKPLALDDEECPYRCWRDIPDTGLAMCLPSHDGRQFTRLYGELNDGRSLYMQKRVAGADIPASLNRTTLSREFRRLSREKEPCDKACFAKWMVSAKCCSVWVDEWCEKMREQLKERAENSWDEFSEIQESPTQWSRLFDLSYSGFIKRIKRGDIRVLKVSDRRWRIHKADLKKAGLSTT